MTRKYPMPIGLPRENGLINFPGVFIEQTRVVSRDEE